MNLNNGSSGLRSTSLEFIRRTREVKVNIQTTRRSLLGFNEPDQDEQSNISVEKALEKLDYVDRYT